MDDPSLSSEACSLSVADIGDDPGQVLIRDERNIFKPLRTIPVAVLQIILQGCLLAESIWLFQFADSCQNQTVTSTKAAIPSVYIPKLSTIIVPCDCVSFLTYSYTVLWTVAFMLDWWRKFLHRDRRNVGYLHMYDCVTIVSRVPFTGMSLGGFLLLIAMSLDRQGVLFTHKEIFGKPSIWLFLQILVGCEFVLTLVSLAIYIARVYRFNSTQPVPDIFNATNISSMPVMFNSRSIVEIGPGIQDCNNDTAVLQTVCERQGDMIKYLRRRCDILCEKLQETPRHVA